MTNWRGSNTELKDFAAGVKVIHVTCGIAIWEAVSTLTYEWTIFTKKRPYRWTIWIHLICRVSSLISFILLLGHVDSFVKSRCQPFKTGLLVCAYISVALGSLLIVLRVIAVWERSKPVSVFSALLWLTSIALNFREPFLVTTTWSTKLHSCALVVGDTFIVNVPTMVASDLLLLLLMLAGLLRKPEARCQGIFRLMYYQGIVWLLVATLVGVPSLVLVALNLNDPLDLALQPIMLASLSICATRMYRSLAKHGSVFVYRAGSNVNSPPRFIRHDTTTRDGSDNEGNANSVLDIA